MTQPRRLVSFLFMAFLLGAAGCRQPQSTNPATETPRQAQQAQARALARKEATARDTLDQIPPPSKHRYLSVHSTDAWINPFLSVHRNSVTLRVIFPQQTGSPVDGGSLLHPEAARKQEMEVRIEDLPDALAAVPDFAWPYGRVVAIEESATASKLDRTQVRRNVEATLQVMNDLGIVVDEWNATGGLLH